MALSKKLMLSGEHEILTIRTHIKALILAALLLILVCAAAGFAVAIVPEGDAQGWIRAVIGVLALILILWWCVTPFVAWQTSTYHITNKRLVYQTGFIARKGRDIPLSRINHVTFDKDLTDRLFGCGTLTVHDASEQAGLILDDVPHVENVHRTLNELVFAAHEGPTTEPEQDDDQQPDI